MQKKLRKIVISGEAYLWKLTTKYRVLNLQIKEYRALVEVTVYKSGMKNTPLVVQFDLLEDSVSGTQLTCNARKVNLHRPAYIRWLIEAGLAQGWRPERKGLTLKEGVKILAQCRICLESC